MCEAIVAEHRPTRFKFDTGEEIADLLKRSTVLQRETHQAGHDVVEADQFRGTVRPVHTQEQFGRLFMVVDAEVQRVWASDFDFLRDMVASGGEQHPISVR